MPYEIESGFALIYVLLYIFECYRFIFYIETYVNLFEAIKRFLLCLSEFKDFIIIQMYIIVVFLCSRSILMQGNLGSVISLAVVCPEEGVRVHRNTCRHLLVTIAL